MTDYDLEKRLRTALDHAAPNDLDGLLSQCTPQRQKIIPMSTPVRTSHRKRWTSLIAACLALVLVGTGAGIGFYQTAGAVASVVSLDVNPGVKLEVNRREKVLSAVALNDDADDILDGMELKGTDLNVAVNAAMLGASASFLGVFGTDALAQYIQQILVEQGVEFSHCRTFPGENGYARVTLQQGERIFWGSNRGGVLQTHPVRLSREDLDY